MKSLAAQHLKSRDVASWSARRATSRDIPVLIAICRDGFPNSPRWRSVSLGRRWWEAVLSGNASELWVVEDNDCIGGFVLLVLDEKRWEAERSKREGGLFSRARRGARSLWRRARRSHTDGAVPAPRVAELDSCGPALAHVGPSERLWLELIAVSTACRGQGLGKRLLEIADNRARQHGRRAVRLRVERSNVTARSLDERHGYRLNRIDGNGCIYTRYLDDAVTTAT